MKAIEYSIERFQSKLEGPRPKRQRGVVGERMTSRVGKRGKVSAHGDDDEILSK